MESLSSSLRVPSPHKLEESENQIINCISSTAGCKRCDSLDKLICILKSHLKSLQEQVKNCPAISRILEQIETRPLTYPSDDHLMITTKALREKSKACENAQTECERLRIELRDSERLRMELQASIAETTEEFDKRNTETQKLNHILTNDRNKAYEMLNNVNSELRQTVINEEQAQASLKIISQQLASALAKNYNFEDMRKEYTEMKEALTHSEKCKYKLQSKLKQILQEFIAAHKQSQEGMSRFKARLEEVEKQLAEAQELLNFKVKLIEDKDQQISHLRVRIVELEGQLTLQEDQIDHLCSLERRYKHSEEAKEKLSIHVNELSKRLDKDVSDLKSTIDKLIDDKKGISSKFQSIEHLLISKETELSQLRDKNMQYKARITMLEQVICVKEDIFNLSDKLKDRVERYEKLNSQLLQDLDSIVDELVSISDKNWGLQKITVRMKDIIDSRIPYKPIEGDLVDETLARFLNTRPVPIRISFTREEPGIYIFGTRKVLIKVEQGKLIIRVGGGFMNIEEFLEIYTPIEYEKLDLHKIDRFSISEKPTKKFLSPSDDTFSNKYTTSQGISKRTYSPPTRMSKVRVTQDMFKKHLSP
jgi:chromosome segregation ATPase